MSARDRLRALEDSSDRSDVEKKLAEHFVKYGFPCVIEAGTYGLQIYAGSREHAERIASDLANTIRGRTGYAAVTPPRIDPAEPEETKWWSAVDFDWRKF